MIQGPEPQRTWWKFEVRLGDLITLALILASFIIGWVKMDGRLTNVEQWQVRQDRVMEKVTDNQARVMESLAKIDVLLSQHDRRMELLESTRNGNEKK